MLNKIVLETLKIFGFKITEEVKYQYLERDLKITGSDIVDFYRIIDEVLEQSIPVEKDIELFVGPDKIYLQIRAVPLKNEENDPGQKELL